MLECHGADRPAALRVLDVRVVIVEPRQPHAAQDRVLRSGLNEPRTMKAF